MKSITIHNMDPELAARLARRAREAGMSLNRAIKHLLASALGLPAPGPVAREGRFEDLCGIWDKAEAAAFRRAVRGLDRIDPEDWK